MSEATNDLNKATLQWLNDLTAQGIFTTDTALRIQGWNRWLENHSGYRAADVLGRNLLDVYPELVERRLDQWYHQALSGQVMVLAHRLHNYLLPMVVHESGSAFAQMQQSARIAPLTAEGRIIGTITVIEDVTEREAREAALQHQIAALEALHDVSNGILSLDLPECLERLVETTAALVHAPTVAVVLRYNDRLHIEAGTVGLHDIDNARVNLSNSTALAVIRSGQPLFVADLAAKQSLTPLDPKSRSVMATPLIADSRVIGGLIIEAPTPDVFSRVEQTQVMMLATQAAIGIHNAQLYREAQEAIHARDTFISIASHELKTPLTTLLGSAQMLQRRISRELSLNERDTRTIGVIAAQAIRINRMITALLDLSRIQTGQLSIERESLDLCLLVQRVVDEMQPMLDYHTIALRIPDEPLVIEGDELRLEQVVQNLLQNAVKYSPSSYAIQVQVQRHGHMVCLQVIDTGIGIPEAALPLLFTRFYRASNVQAQHISGMGVGLHIVKEIIDLHGGQVAVTSQEGHGSTFSVCLQLAGEPQVGGGAG